MDFQVYLSKVLPVDSEGFAIIDAAALNPRSGLLNPGFTGRNQPGFIDKNVLAQIVDRMGEASSIAQGLKSIITTYSKFTCSGDNKLYIKVDGKKVCGILKTGKKNLFHYDGLGNVKELKPLCVLDFYVHESMQRVGVGRALFEKMLEHEGVEPRKLAIDRPSPKFISFLKKHYGLTNYVPQNNNFVIFNNYFESSPSNLGSNQPKEESKELRLQQIKNTSQTDFHRVGKSIIDYSSNTYSRNNQANPDPYSNQRELLNSQQNPSVVSNDNYYNKDKFTSYGKDYKVSPGLETHSKPMEGNFVKPTDRNYGQQSIVNAQNQNLKNYYSRTPWASSSTSNNLDSFRSSLAYGNHYNQSSLDFSYGRRK